jgi:hypothetical protein
VKRKPDHRGTVAVILATAVGLALLGALVLVLGPWTPVPEERIVLELFSLVAAITGGLAVWLGMGGKDHDDDEDGP